MRHALTALSAIALLVAGAPAVAGDRSPAERAPGTTAAGESPAETPAGEDAAPPPAAPLPSAIDVLTPDAVNRLVVDDDGVGACLQDALSRGLTLPPRIWITFTIQPDGSISAADVLDAELAGSDVATCVSTAVRRGRFPAFAERDAKSVRVPLAPPLTPSS